jgi:hypothetical protein
VFALFNAAISSSGQLTGTQISSGDYQDGGFSIALNAIPASSLKNVRTFFADYVIESADLDISDPDARLLDADFFGISSTNLYVDYFAYTNSTSSNRTSCLFVYADSDVTVKGGKNVSVVLLRGWNRIYITPSDKKISSKAPKGMKWYLRSDLK